MPFARTDAGISIQSFEEIRDELAAAFTNPSTGIHPDLDTSDDSLFGRLIALLADREANLQQQILAVYADTTVGATGVALTRLAQLTGTIRRPATFSTVTLSVVLTAPLPAGARVSDASGSVVFETLATINTTGSVQARALDPGPVVAPANTLTRRVSSSAGLSGWTSVTNPTGAVVGSAEETDGELRLRRVTELNESADASISAIATGVRGVEGVVSLGTVNDTALHEFEVIVYGPTADSDEIAQAIWDNAPAGIAAVTHGGTPDTGNAVDSEGVTHAIAFTRATEVNIYTQVDLLHNDQYPSDGDDQVAAAITTSMSGRGVGVDVVQSRLYSAVYSIPGVVDVSNLYIGTSPGPTLEDNITIGYDEVAVPGTITVNSTPA